MPEGVRAVQVRYNEATLRKAVRTFVWRRFVLEQKLMWAAAGVMLLLCVWLLVRRDRSWLVMVTGAAALLPLLLVLVGWCAHLYAKLHSFRSMPEPEAEFAFDAQGYRATSGLGEMGLPWSSVTEAWARPDFWMLIIASNQFVTLPTQNVPAETFDRLRSWLGAKVIDL